MLDRVMLTTDDRLGFGSLTGSDARTEASRAPGEDMEFPRFRGHLIAGPSGPAARIDVHAVYRAVFA
jgi:hypothetical protein